MPQNATLFIGVIAEDNSVLETMSHWIYIMTRVRFKEPSNMQNVWTANHCKCKIEI